MSLTRIPLITSVVLLSVLASNAQSGGSFAISQSVIGGGGGPSTGGTFAVTGTIGQPVSGNASGGAFELSAGFWNNQLAPTAATVPVSGRVIDAAGSPLRNVVISLTDSAGSVIVTRTNTFGYFTFDEVRSGQAYIVNLFSRTVQFVPQVLNVVDSLSGLEFRALP